MIHRRPPAARSAIRVFAAPLAIGGVSMLGLIAALIGDGVLDMVSWTALAVPVATVGWALRTRRR